MRILTLMKEGAAVRPNAKEFTDKLAKSRITLWVTLLATIAFIMWAWLADIDKITRAPGVVIASLRTQIVQSEEGGILESLLVKEGDSVERGQLLAKLESVRTGAAYLEARARAAALAAIVARLRAEVLGGEPQFPAEVVPYPEFRANQMVLLKKRRAAINQDVAALEVMAGLVQKELDMNKPLLESGDVSMTDVLRLERQLADLHAQITNKKNKYFQDSQAELSKALEDLTAVEQTMAQKKDQLDHAELRAPVNGVVKNVRVTTRGGVIRPGEEVMEIVPGEDDLVVEARVSPADIAFIAIGMHATVKIDAYDYTIYGDLPGKLTYISPDTLKVDLREGEPPYYRAQIRTEGRRFRGRPSADLEIQPGMTATIEVKTGSNTVLHYLAKPVVKTLAESLGER